jgi:hypothetical protein
MIDYRPSHSVAAGGLAGVHRLQVRVGLVQPLQRSDPEEHTIPAGTEERDGRVHQVVDLHGVYVIGWRDLSGERQMPVQESSDVVNSRVVDGDDNVHAGSSAEGTHTEATRKNVPLRAAATNKHWAFPVGHCRV